MSRKLFNVKATVVTLLWAETEDGAAASLNAELDRKGYTVIDSDAFVSEPVPEMAWEGDNT